MHQKKSEVQIGKESVGVSSDFNPSPPLQYQKHPYHRHQFYPQIEIDISPPPPRDAAPQRSPPSLSKPPLFKSHNAAFFSVTVAAKSAAFRALRRVRRQRALLLLAVPLLYLYFLVSRSFLLDLLSAIAFSAALVFSLNLAFPLPLRSIRLKAPSAVVARPAPPLPVFWTIGSRPKSEKRVASGCWVQVFGNGDVYEGEFHRGKCSGSGVYYYSRSGRYEGDWVDGKYDGYGVETWARGSRYRGCYRQGLRNGFGVYRFYTGDVYAGEWSNGQSHGCGIHTCEDGSRYVGEFKWGVKHGLGHYHFSWGQIASCDGYNGDSSLAAFCITVIRIRRFQPFMLQNPYKLLLGLKLITFVEDYREQFEIVYVGPLHCKDPEYLSAERKKSRMNRSCTSRIFTRDAVLNGDTYAGEYFADKMHGFGIYCFANGHRYEGAWHEGRRQGLGMYTFRNGETQSGHWQNGVLDIPSTQNATNPVSPVGVCHSKVLNAVQEARRAAEKAYDVAKVDDGVNRAVAASNRAANAARVAAVKAVQKQMHHVNNESFSIPVV
ncbi:Radial spoke head 1-like protein, partial [Mucuna pruriens]